ncbi:acetyl-CoA carboxylase biotin carboxyl carrier protein [Nocardia asteroides]|uniref:acetyl-CoA carboxylase biotin carboxyl carrier protein n=1 Tax=Nocardia asteroides TaxID=1824 RepID=UPI001E5640CF|nr:biotin/lipoyl-containing protein [Nocardia asteroides]UGT63378.1 hypothetical protein LTT61_08725 [Nocardia asteroides]
MTTARSETGATEDDHEYLRILSAMQAGALRLLAGFPRQPSALRLRVGEVTVEAEWPAVTEAAGTAPVAAEPPGAAPEAAPVGPVIRAPSVGVFYRRPEPGATPFVEVGDRVSTGQQIAIVEAMKLMIPVTSTVDGVITAILKQDDEPVHYDEPLFSCAPG